MYGTDCMEHLHDLGVKKKRRVNVGIAIPGVSRILSVNPVQS